MNYAAGVFLALVAAGMAIMLALQVLQFATGRTVLTFKHLLLRLASGLLMLLVIASIYVGVAWDFSHPLYELVYWAGVLGASAAVAGLAVVDLRWVERAKHRQRAELYRRLAEVEAELRQAKGDEE